MKFPVNPQQIPLGSLLTNTFTITFVSIFILLVETDKRSNLPS